MVVISVKKSDGEGFLFETTTDTPNTDLISALVRIHNLRLQARVVIDAVRSLARYGPMNDPQKFSSTDMNGQEAEGNRTLSYDADADDLSSTTFVPDPSGIRSGNAPDPNLAEILMSVVQDLEKYIDKSQVQNRIALRESILNDKIVNVKGAVTMAYPMGLPDWDSVKQNLDSTKDIKGILIPENTSLWVAGKEFPIGKLVSDRLGTNEKQKVIAKLQPTAEGAPSREPVVSEDERKAMMAHYFKRQEELKKLNEADDDDYLNSPWADPKEMKRGIHLKSKCVAPGIRF